MAVFFMQWGEYFNNVVYAVLMGILLYASVHRLRDRQQRFLSALILIYCLLEYGLWISSCYWQESVLSEPYYWFDFALTASFFLFLPTATLQQIIFSFYYRFVIQACCFLKRVFFCVLIDDR